MSMCFKLIAVTDRKLCAGTLAGQLELAARCASKPQAVILREKDLPETDYLALLRELRPLCRQWHMRFIAHSFWQAAAHEGVRCLHLPLGLLRGSDFRRCRHYFDMVGTSVHSLPELREAVGLGADYLVAGHIFPTACKPGMEPRGLDFLRAACAATPLPVYAIGGIGFDAGQWAALQNAGAAGACIRSGYMLPGMQNGI